MKILNASYFSFSCNVLLVWLGDPYNNVYCPSVFPEDRRFFIMASLMSKKKTKKKKINITLPADFSVLDLTGAGVVRIFFACWKFVNRSIMLKQMSSKQTIANTMFRLTCSQLQCVSKRGTQRVYEYILLILLFAVQNSINCISFSFSKLSTKLQFFGSCR